MMELTNKNIEEYINRFLDGETTNAEEQAIYRFFLHRQCARSPERICTDVCLV